MFNLLLIFFTWLLMKVVYKKISNQKLNSLVMRGFCILISIFLVIAILPYFQINNNDGFSSFLDLLLILLLAPCGVVLLFLSIFLRGDSFQKLVRWFIGDIKNN